MQLTRLDQALWAATFIEDLVLMSVLLFRRKSRGLAAFAALIGLDIIRTLTLLLLQEFGSRAEYFYTYWSLALVDMALQFGVLFTIATRIFRPSGKWARDTFAEIAIMLMASVFIATLLTYLAHPSVALPLQIMLLKGNFFSALLLSEISVGIFALSVRSGLSWAAYHARVMQGLTVYFLSTLALETARTYFGLAQGSQAYTRLAHARILIYVFCMAYWIVALWRDPPATREMSARMRQQVATLHEALAGRLEARRAVAKS